MAERMSVIMVAWSLLVAPTLCVAGVLEHACMHASQPHADHEQPCPAEPCCETHDDPVPPISPIGGLARSAERNAGTLACQPAACALLPQPVFFDSEGATRRHDPPRIPFPLSDLPLLI